MASSFLLRPSKCRVGTEPRWFFIKGSEFNVSPLHSHYRIMGWVGIAVAGGPIQLPLGDTHKLLDRGKDAPYTPASRGCQSALPLILIPSVRAFGRVSQADKSLLNVIMKPLGKLEGNRSDRECRRS